MARGLSFVLRKVLKDSFCFIETEAKTRQANHPNSVTLPELLNLHPESGTFVSFPRFYAVYLRNICSKGPEMQQRLSASPEQLQRPACLMFEAAFICIYRELGLCLEACPSHCFCIFTWEEYSRVSDAGVSTSTFSYTFQRRFSRCFCHNPCLRRKDSTPAPTEAPVMSSFSQPWWPISDDWWLVFGLYLYWFWNCEGWVVTLCCGNQCDDMWCRLFTE